MNVSALLLISSSCPHCATVLQALTELLKSAEISRLEIVNLEVDPEFAQSLNVRSVPWIRIGQFELTGAQTKAELSEWIRRSQSDEGMTGYLQSLLEAGQISDVTDFVSRHEQHFAKLLHLLVDADVKINVRIGISAVIESLENSELLQSQVTLLGEFIDHESTAVRADICHFLSLTGHPDAISFVEKCTADSDAEVREIAFESLETLKEA